MLKQKKHKNPENMNEKEKLQSIKEITKCNDDIAKKALSQTNDLNTAIKIAKDLMKDEYYVGGKSGLCVQSNNKKITEFQNGILITQGDLKTFYNYEDKKNLELKKMLDKKEFDARLLGGKEDEHVQIVYEDMKSKKYEEPKKEKQPQVEKKKVIELKNLPDRIEIVNGSDDTVRFKLLTVDKKVDVIMDSKMKVSDLVSYIKKITGKNVVLRMNNVKLAGNIEISKCNRSLVISEIVQ